MHNSDLVKLQQRLSRFLNKYQPDGSTFITLSPVDGMRTSINDVRIALHFSNELSKNDPPIMTFNINTDIIDAIQVHAKQKVISVIQLFLYEFPTQMQPVLLAYSQKLCKSLSAYLLVCAPNIAREDIALQLMAGQFIDPYTNDSTGCSAFFTHQSLNQLLNDAGFTFVEEDNLELEQTETSDNVFLAKGTMLYDHLSFYRNLSDSYGNVQYFIRMYQPILSVQSQIRINTDDHPFLSVVIRTIGNRLESLREVFLCLAAQDDTDFEVLLVGHKLTDDRKGSVIGLLDELPPFLASRTRMITVGHGNRSTPLNEGFSQARGTYIVALDDDDLVTGDWVQRFHDGYKEAPGALLHCYCVSQEWSIFTEENGLQKLFAAAAPNKIFCQPFNWREQYKVNRCPLMTIAFPGDAFHRFPYRFDEKLDTVEDWDYIMTMAMLLGVHDIPHVTAIYRLWINAQNSYTLHNKEEWDKNMAYVLDKLSHIPMMFPRGALIDKEVGRVTVDGVSSETDIFGEQEGHPHKICRVKPTKQQHFPNKIVTEFDDLGSYRLHGRIRLDPTDVAHYELTNLSIQATMEDGSAANYGIKNVTTNGAKKGNSILFPADDPQIFFELPKGILASLHVSYTLCWGIPVKKLVRFLSGLIIMCIRSGLRKIGHKIVVRLRRNA